jgi:hypothetical protein
MILRHRDRELLRFDWVEPQGVRIVSVNDDERRFLPLEMKGEATDEKLWAWLRRRIVPKNRHYVEAMLGHLGIRQKDTRAIIELCKGLSLNDVHWVVPDGFSGRWRDFNLYANEFSRTLAVMAFTGTATSSLGKAKDLSTSPEFTTNGMLAKCWRRKDGATYLYKSGTEGAANLGFEPYSEFYAAQIAVAMELPHVEYGLEKFKGRLCSTCPLFTSDRLGFLPAGAIMSKDEAVADPRFHDIFLFDAVVFNTDRHLGNLGFMVDNDSNEIVGPAPIFDNGNSLFSLALYRPNSHYDDFADLRKFIARISPVLYDNWLSFPGGVTDEMKQRLARLKRFRFSRHKYYNLPAARLKIIEDFIQRRIVEILDAPCRSADGPSATSKAVAEGSGTTSGSADGSSAYPKAVAEGLASSTQHASSTDDTWRTSRPRSGIFIGNGQHEADEPSARRQGGV